MRIRFRTVVGMVVVSVLVFVVGFSSVWRGWFLDASEATAQKIQPGMTLAEAEQIIGCPPGSYTFGRPRTNFRISGNATPNEISWTTYQGTITVADGLYGPDNQWYLKPDGVVDWVKWERFVAAPDTYNPWIAIILGVTLAVFMYWVFIASAGETPHEKTSI
ncbi:MAG: hypothetical protein K8U57_17310 [Planctomycetes bacterium]|nr:hypothetical protein [Planctomycetota bacterium]